MKIHSSVITSSDIWRAVTQLPGVYADVKAVGSRSRSVGYEIRLESDGTLDQHGNRRNWRAGGGTRGAGFDRPNAASWADWGHLLGALYALDPDMVTPYYSSRDDFDRQTGGRFVYAVQGLGATTPTLTETSAKRLKECSTNLSRHELDQHGW